MCDVADCSHRDSLCACVRVNGAFLLIVSHIHHLHIKATTQARRGRFCETFRLCPLVCNRFGVSRLPLPVLTLQQQECTRTHARFTSSTSIVTHNQQKTPTHTNALRPTARGPRGNKGSQNDVCNHREARSWPLATPTPPLRRRTNQHTPVDKAPSLLFKFNSIHPPKSVWCKGVWQHEMWIIKTTFSHVNHNLNFSVSSLSSSSTAP